MNQNASGAVRAATKGQGKLPISRQHPPNSKSLQVQRWRGIPPGAIDQLLRKGSAL